MNIDKLYDLYSNNLKSILTPHMLATIADRTYDIHGFNLINRLLIYIQNKYTTSLKSESGWEVIGRSVKSKSSPIWVIENVIKTEYIDPETSEIVKDTGLSTSDINRAIKFGILTKVKTATGLKCVPLYNIKDTEVIDKNIFKTYRIAETQSIKISILLGIASNDFGITCRKSDSDSAYNAKENNIYIGNDSFDKKVYAVVTGIADQIDLDTILDTNINPEAGRAVKEICTLFMVESLASYCNKDKIVEPNTFNIIKKLDTSNNDVVDSLIKGLSSIYDIVEEIICLINPNNHNISESTLRKAAELLDILEANEAMVQLKG